MGRCCLCGTITKETVKCGRLDMCLDPTCIEKDIDFRRQLDMRRYSVIMKQNVKVFK